MPPDAAERGAVMLLRACGVPDDEAREIAARPLPQITVEDAAVVPATG